MGKKGQSCAFFSFIFASAITPLPESIKSNSGTQYMASILLGDLLPRLFSYVVSDPVPMSNFLFNSFHTRDTTNKFSLYADDI